MSDYLFGTDVVIGDMTPCGPQAREKGYTQFRLMLQSYQDAPVEIQRKWHAEVYGLQENWNDSVGRWQSPIGQANCAARDIGENAEKLRAKIAKDAGQGYVEKPSTDSFIPWWVWLVGGLAVGGAALAFAAPHVVRAVATSRAAWRKSA